MCQVAQIKHLGCSSSLEREGYDCSLSSHVDVPVDYCGRDPLNVASADCRGHVQIVTHVAGVVGTKLLA
jgi:hypothetical protein